MKERFEGILSFINAGIYEKEDEIKMALLATLAGENIILLGPPGVAKSMIARRLSQIFCKAQSFEYLMSRFSTPDEIFGPVSISKLKDSDRYERALEGYLPTADIAFLDEIWKAGPAIQNTLLSVINEKVFHNGDRLVKVPLKLLVAASNELPATGEGLEALWDRFLIRIVSKSIESDDNFCRMLTDVDNKQPLRNIWQISQEEYDAWQKQIAEVEVPMQVLNAICRIRQLVQHIELKEENCQHDIYISDRRWKKIVHLLRTVAFMHDRKAVEISDLIICTNCLWQEPNEIEDIRHLVLCEMLKDIELRYDKLQELVGQQLRLSRVREALYRIKHLEGMYTSTKINWQQEIEMKRNNLLSLDYRTRIYDNFYCYVKTHGIGKTYFYFADFIRLSHNPSNPTLCVFFKDPKDETRTLIRLYSDTDQYGTTDIEVNNVYRPELEDPYDPTIVYINGVEHHIDFLGADEKQEFVNVSVETVNLEMNTEVAVLRKELDEREQTIRANLFFSPADDQPFKQCIMPLKNKIRNTELESTKIKC